MAEGFDDFWSHKKAVFEPDQTDPDLFKTGDELAAEWDWRWCMILMTRPIDTLVITLSDPESISGIILKEVSKDIPDIVEWRS